MELMINKTKTIEEIQKQFTSQFPYLKILFYRHPCTTNNDCKTDNLISPNKTIGEISPKPYAGVLGVSGNQKTAALKKIFQDVYGLNVQVFRQSGSMWMQPIDTDERTIDEQNEIARIYTERDAYLAG